MAAWLLLLLLPLVSCSCPTGQFSTTNSYVFCVGGQQTSVASTRGTVSLISTGTTGSFQCQVLLAPNVSMGLTFKFSIRVHSIDAEAPIQLIANDVAVRSVVGKEVGLNSTLHAFVY